MSLREELELLNMNEWQNDLVKIRPLTTEKELVFAAYECQLTDEQKNFVSPIWFTIGRAYLYKDDNYPCIIYNLDNMPIGFINFYKWIGDKNAYSWSYFIDLKYQKKGFGISTAKLAVDILKKTNSNICIKIASEKDNYKAHNLYLSLGFNKSPKLDGDDIVFVL